jgi:preprotein translocase SecE subunit
MNKVTKFFTEVKQELARVSWVSRREALTSTVLVLVVVVIFAILCVLTDFIVLRVVQFITKF